MRKKIRVDLEGGGREKKRGFVMELPGWKKKTGD